MENNSWTWRENLKESLIMTAIGFVGVGLFFVLYYIGGFLFWLIYWFIFGPPSLVVGG